MMKYFAGTIILFGLYCVLAAHSMHEPLLGDSFASPMSAEEMYSGKEFNAYHPALYYGILSVAIHAGREGAVEQYRVIGMVCFLATLVMVIYMTRSYANDFVTAMLAGCIYAVNPMVIKGSLITDIDSTVLPPLLMLFIMTFQRVHQNISVRSMIALALLFALALWTKETTPLILIVSMTAYYFIRREYAVGLKTGTILLVSGISLFLVTWISSPHFIPGKFSPLYMFAHLARAFGNLNAVTGNDTNIMYVLRSVFRLTLWLSPGFLLLLLLYVARRGRALLRGAQVDFADYLAVYAMLVLLGYTFVGNIAFGFPKYHYPLVPIASVLLALTVAPLFRSLERREKLLYLLTGAALTVVNLILVGDLLYRTDYQLREAMAAGASARDFLRRIAPQILIYFATLPAAFLIIRLFNKRHDNTRALTGALFLCMVAANAATDMLQYRADYLTVYCYGGKIAQGFLDDLKAQHASGKRLLLPEDIWYSIGVRCRLSNRIWNDPEKFLETLRADGVDIVVYGLSSNSLSQYLHTFNNQAVRSYLNAHFFKKEYGSYTVWTRHD